MFILSLYISVIWICFYLMVSSVGNPEDCGEFRTMSRAKSRDSNFEFWPIAQNTIRWSLPSIQAYLLSCWGLSARHHSTPVENTLQIFHQIRNKPNVKIGKIALCLIKDYENLWMIYASIRLKNISDRYLLTLNTQKISKLDKKIFLTKVRLIWYRYGCWSVFIRWSICGFVYMLWSQFVWLSEEDLLCEVRILK